MREFQILTDAVSDLPPSWVRAHNYLTIVDTPIVVSGPREVLDFVDLGPDDFEQVAQYVERGYNAFTSQPAIFDPDGENPRSVESLTKFYLDQGKDVIYVTMNGTLSGTFEMATILYRDLDLYAMERGRRLLCIDSHCMSTGLALLFLEIDAAIQSGQIDSIEKVADYVGIERGHIGHFFTWRKLDYIKRSGRVSSVQSIVADILHLRLMCSAQYSDPYTRKLEHINPHARIIGLNGFAKALGIYAKRHIQNPAGPIIIAHGNAPHDAELVANRLREYLPEAEFLMGPEWRCGAGIQVHGGPTSLHINFHTDTVGTLKETTEEMEAIILGLRRG